MGDATGHKGFEVLDFTYNADPLQMREMPHLDADVDVAGKRLNVVDLRIERYPVPQDEKARLMRAFQKTGLVGELHGELLHFKPDYSVEVIDRTAARQLPRLPTGWERTMKYVEESKLPSMTEVFRLNKENR